MERAGTPWHAASTLHLGFARFEAAGSSPVYERLAMAVCHSDALDLLATLPGGSAGAGAPVPANRGRVSISRPPERAAE